VGPRRRQTLTFHRAVALAFLGNPPSAAHEVAHNDGDPRNNAPSNLRWATHADNNADRERHGTDVHGEKSATALLTNDQARAIRARALGGERGIDLAVEFGVSKHIVSLIKLGRTYKDA
jgi:hypothetical protein